MVNQRAGVMAVLVGLLCASPALAEDLTFTTYYPAPSSGGGGGVRGPDAVVGDATYQASTPPTNGMLVQGKAIIGANSSTTPGKLEVIANVPAGQGSYGVYAIASGAGSNQGNIAITGLAQGANSQQNMGGQFIAVAEGANQPATGVFSSAGDSSATQNVSSILGGSFQAQHINARPLPDMMGVLANVYRGGPGLVTTERGLRVGRGGSGPATNTYGIQIGSQQGTATNNYGLYIENQLGATNNYALYSEGGQNYFGGNVGIGLTTPTARLDVNPSNGFVGDATGWNVRIVGGRNTIGGADQTSGLLLEPTANHGWTAQAPAIRLMGGNGLDVYSDAGNAGWLTLAHTYPGASGSGGLRLTTQATNAGGTTAFSIATGGSGGVTERFRITSAGNVGIGTTAPAYPLHVFQNNPGNGAGVLKVEGNATGQSSILLTNSSPGGQEWRFDSMGSGSGWTGGLAIRTAALVSPPPFFISGATGNVGIGIANPTSKLHVVGTFTATGAKNFEINHPTKPGYTLVHSSVEGPEAAVFYRGPGAAASGRSADHAPGVF